MSTQPTPSGEAPGDGVKNPTRSESNKGCLVISVMVLLAIAATLAIVMLAAPGQL